MANKIAYIIDGSIIFTKNQFKKEKNIFKVNFSILDQITHKTYYDDIDIIPRSFFIDLKDNGHKLKTSQPSPYDVGKLIEKIFEQRKYEKIVFWLIHPEFSSTHKTISVYVKDLPSEISDKILVLHTKSFFLQSLTDFLEIKKIGNETESFDKISEQYEKITKNDSLIGIIQNIQDIIAGGRFGKYINKLPLINFNKFKLSIYLGKRVIIPVPFLISRGFVKIINKYTMYITKGKFNNKDFSKTINVYYSKRNENQDERIVAMIKKNLPDYKVYLVQWPLIFTITFGHQYVIQNISADTAHSKNYSTKTKISE